MVFPENWNTDTCGLLAEGSGYWIDIMVSGIMLAVEKELSLLMRLK